MATRKILNSSDAILRKLSKPVAIFDADLHSLLDDMKDTMTSAQGCGLAAPQVGVLKQVVVANINGSHLELINPKIIKQSGKQILTEGCLSVPNFFAYVERPSKVTVKAVDRFGDEFEITGSRYLAQVLCHEIDHLNGVIFTDIMKEEYIPKKKK